MAALPLLAALGIARSAQASLPEAWAGLAPAAKLASVGVIADALGPGDGILDWTPGGAPVYFDFWLADETVAAGTVVRASVSSASFDPWMSVSMYNRVSDLVVSDDDGGPGWDAYVEYVVPVSGRVQVFVKAADAGTGPYTLTLDTTFPVAGRVTLTGQSDHSGVTVTFTRVTGTGTLPEPVQTDGQGAWAASGFDPGTIYLATPSRPGWDFTPASLQFSTATSFLDFVGQPPGFAVSGTATLAGQSEQSGTAIAFALLSGSGAVPAAVQTDAAGAWAAVGFTPGATYLATPYRAGWTFTPASAEFGAATTGLDFAGSQPLAGLLVRAVVGSSRLSSPAQIVVGRRAVIEVLRYGAADQHDSSAVATFALTVPAVLGTASGADALRLTTVAGVTGAVAVTAEGRTELFAITTLPGAVDHLVIEPTAVSLSPGEQLDFDARGADVYGNVFALTGANVAWHCVPATLGTVTAAGLFTAGSAGGTGYVLAVVSRGLRFGDTEVTRGGTGRIVIRDSLPRAFALQQNTPNPFNPETTIRFDLAQGRTVRLEVYDASGQRVRLLADGALAAGSHAVRWDGTDQGGVALGSGVYLVRLTAGDFVCVRKALLVR